MTSSRLVVALLGLALLGGCKARQGSAPVEGVSSTPQEVEAEEVAARPEMPSFAASTVEAPGTIVALGDVHGDYDAMHTALKSAGLVDDDGAWVGETATLVQTGDLLDRGDDEQKIVDYLRALAEEANAAGGQIVQLNGNHEVMNVAGDLRYITPGGFADFEDVEGLDLESPMLQQLPETARPRMAAFMPGGPYARILADHRIIAIVDDTVFAHGGVLPHHVEYGIDKINAQSSAWMRGEADPPLVLQNENAPTWTRAYSQESPDCATLEKTLDLLGAERLVVGHTVQPDGVTSACDEKVWRVDVGMSAHYGGKPAALRIDGGTVSIMKPAP